MQRHSWTARSSRASNRVGSQRVREEMIDLGGDQVLAMIRMTAHGKGSGIEVDVRLADVATIREGKLAHWTGYPGRRQALKAVGLDGEAMSQERS